MWAKKMGIKPEDIELVSIMPCTAKKYEAIRSEMKIGKLFPIDHVLTTRELSFMIKKNNIDFANIKPEKNDDPLGQFTGGAALFGGSGGVMESALRTAAWMACGKSKTKACVGKIDFNETRGLAGIKEAKVNVGGAKVSIAVVNGIGNIGPVLANLDKYHYIEVMACPGGCIGGGGQSTPISDEIRQMRIDALYKIDFKNKLRRSYENKAAMEAVEWMDKNKMNHKVVHTKYRKRSS
jgi:iron only hydrogenase large subunit-like protein